MKIGILTPRSKAYPLISRDFMDGLKIYLESKKLNTDIEFICDSVGFGGSEKEVYDKAEQLLKIEEVDVLFAYVDEKVLDFLYPLIYACNKLMIVINAGANYPINWVPQPTIIHLTLQQSFCCWLTGPLATNSSANSAATASTFYDCGYLHVAAMVNSFIKKNGSITFHYTNNQAYDNKFHINELINFLSKNTDTKKILCLFDTLPASLFYNQLNKYGDAKNLGLFASPMMLQQNIFDNEDGYNFSVEGYVPWLTSLESPANIEFANTIKERVNKEANMFLLSGWEAGIVVEQLFLNCKEKYNDGESLVKYLKQKKLNSPRGELKLDDATQFYLSSPYKCSIKQGSTKIEIERMEDYEEEWKLFTEEPTIGPVAGWTNTYLCY